MINQVPNLNRYPISNRDERFGFLPFVGGLAVGALAGGFGGSRPCGPMCGPMPMQQQVIPIMQQQMPMQQQVFFQQPQIQPFQPFEQQVPIVQGPMLETNKYFIR